MIIARAGREETKRRVVARDDGSVGSAKKDHLKMVAWWGFSNERDSSPGNGNNVRQIKT
jgi:hypothetical protein